MTIKNSEKGRDISNTEESIGVRIKNPLRDIPENVLREQVQEFARSAKLGDSVNVLTKGALVAQRPKDFESVDDLDEEDRKALREEIASELNEHFGGNKTNHVRADTLGPAPALANLTLLGFLATTIHGWDLTLSNGAGLVFPGEFGLSTEAGSPSASKNAWIIGLIMSAPYISSCLIGCWLTDPLNNALGRKRTVFVTTLICVLANIGSGLTRTWPQLLACRLLLGLGLGPKSATVPVYVAESASAYNRGKIVLTADGTPFGMFLGFGANLIFYHVPKIAWRLQIASPLIPCIPVLLLILRSPESPRWLMKNGQYRDAYESFKLMRTNEVQAARDFYYAYRHCQYDTSTHNPQSTFLSRFRDLFLVPRTRRATLASFVVMLAQQMSGINLIGLYASTFLLRSGYPIRLVLSLSMLFGIMCFIFGVPALLTMDRLGKRNWFLFSHSNMVWTLLLTGLCFCIPGSSSSRIPLITLFIFLSAVAYSFASGPLSFNYCSEIFPSRHRDMGMAWATATRFLWTTIFMITMPNFLNAIGMPGAFCFFAGMNILCFTLILLLVPEPKQRTLEELDDVFSVPTPKHIKYQANTFFPYVVRRWILRQRDINLPPIYLPDNEISLALTHIDLEKSSSKFSTTLAMEAKA
ncbi:hypothetical protein AX16_001883 [Volvariella volvacea WC 439]|nr:hypothetical protein AX16_001883 [Volvariella volvacea WC 439]